MSSEEPEESLTYNEVNSWRSDALKLWSSGLESFRKQARTGCSCVCSLGNENSCPTDCWRRIATTANEKARLLDLGNGSSLPDPSTLKHWLRESDAITSWPLIFLSDIAVFLTEDHPGKDVALPERVLSEYKEGKAYRLYESGWLKEIYWHPTSTEVPSRHWNINFWQWVDICPFPRSRPLMRSERQIPEPSNNWSEDLRLVFPHPIRNLVRTSRSLL